MKTTNFKDNFRRSLASMMALAMLGGSFALAFPAKAASNPEIVRVVDRGRKSVELRVEDTRFKDDKVVIKVTVTNRATGKEVKTKHFTKTLSDDGRATVRIGGLQPDTQYRFKVKVKEFGKKNYKSGSDSKSVKTKSI